MESQIYHIRISPENIKGDLFKVNFSGAPYDISPDVDPCCELTATTVTGITTGVTYVYSSMTDVLSGGTNGTSLLTGLTIPIMLTQNTIDIGYYSTFDGAVLQKDVLLNFIFSASSGSPYQYYFYNTSETNFLNYLAFSTHKLNWGDGSPTINVTTTSPSFYQHTYPTNGDWTITFSGTSPWGINVVRKKVKTPFTGTTIPNPNGEAFFYPSGGNWSGTPISYDYIFSADSICDVESQVSSGYTNIPIIITGYTESSVTDLKQYGPSSGLTNGGYKLGVKVTGTTGQVGTFYGPSINNLFTGYTINGVDYYDYNDGKTIFIIKSSGFTADWLICTALTKNEALLNVIDEVEIQSNVFIERGKISGLEALERLGEVDNMGDLEKYGYGFFKVIKV